MSDFLATLRIVFAALCEAGGGGGNAQLAEQCDLVERALALLAARDVAVETWAVGVEADAWTIGEPRGRVVVLPLRDGDELIGLGTRRRRYFWSPEAVARFLCPTEKHWETPHDDLYAQLDEMFDQPRYRFAPSMCRELRRAVRHLVKHGAAAELCVRESRALCRRARAVYVSPAKEIVGRLVGHVGLVRMQRAPDVAAFLCPELTVAFIEDY